MADLLLTERADHRRYELEGVAEQLGVGAEASGPPRDTRKFLASLIRSSGAIAKPAHGVC